jgi:iron(III) transport system permease protein
MSLASKSAWTSTTHSIPFRDARPALIWALGLLFLFSILPALVLLTTALRDGTGISLSPLISELQRSSVQRAIGNSLETTLFSAVLSVAIGTAAALMIGTTSLRGKKTFGFLFALSLLIAPHVAALSFKTLAGPASPLLLALGFAPPAGSANPLLGRWGIILVLGLHHAPLVMITVLAGLRQIPHAFIEAAELDGASPLGLLRYVVLPALRSHIAAAALLVSLAALGNFGIPALLGLPAGYLTLPTMLYRELVSFGPGAIQGVAALSLVIAGLAIILTIAAAWTLPQRDTALPAEDRMRPFWQLGRNRIWAEFGMGLLILVTTILPLGSLLLASLVPAYGVSLTFSNMTPNAYVEILWRQADTLSAFRTSLLLSAVAAGLTGISAIPIAYASTRLAGRVQGAFRFAVEWPFALPGLVIGIASILLWLKPIPLINISIYGTGWLILYAYLCRFMALVVKPVSATLGQLDPAIEEAAALCGATFLQRLRYIILPELVPAISAGMIMIFLTAFSELTVSALLWSAGNRTLGVALFGFEEAGLTPEASALGIVTVCGVAMLMLILQALRRWLPDNAVPWLVEPAQSPHQTSFNTPATVR